MKQDKELTIHNLQKQLEEQNRRLQQQITEHKQTQETLRELEERFQQVAENAQEWIWETDTHGLYTYASPVVEKLLGYKPEEVAGEKHFYDFFHPEDREALKKVAFEVFAQKRPFREFINRNVRKNGETIWLSTSGVPILNEKGSLLGYRGADTDITEHKRAEEALQKSEARYRAIVEDQTELICRFLPDGTLTFVNNAYRNYFGKEREELVGYNFMLLIPEENRTGAVKHLASFSLKNPTGTYEHRVLTPGGEIRWQQWTDRAIFDRQDRLVEFQSVGRDITERKQTEEALHKLNVTLEAQVAERTAELTQAVDRLERVRTVGEAIATATTVEARMQAMVQGIVEHLGFDAAGTGLYDPESGSLTKMATYPMDERYQEALQIINLNLSISNEFGRADNPVREQLIAGQPYLGHSLADLLSPPQSHTAIEAIQRLYGIQTILDVPLPSEEKIVGTLFVATHRSKISLQEQQAVQLVARQAATAIANAHSYEALRASEERYRLLFNSGNEAVYIYSITPDNRPGKLIEVNELSCQRSGYSREELLNLSPAHLTAPEKRADTRLAMQKLLAQKYVLFETVVMVKDGQRIPVEITANLFELDGQRIVLSIARDITERKQAEEKLRQAQEQLVRSERLAVIGELAATVAHELRNPLSVIRTSAYYIKGKLVGGDAKVMGSFERLENQIDNSERIIRDLLDFAQVGLPELSLANLNDVVRAALAEAWIPEKVAVDVRLAEELPQTLFDPQQMCRVLLNLIHNAVQAMPQQGRLVVRTWQDKGTGKPEGKETRGQGDQEQFNLQSAGAAKDKSPISNIFVSVSDTGKGISPEHQKHIFESLFTTKARGTGLGLAICRRIIEAHSGSIKVESEIEKGSTFIVQLPVISDR